MQFVLFNNIQNSSSSHPKRFRFHQQFHLANARPTVCLVCDIQFTNERFFYEHVQFAHEPMSLVFCRYCDETFDDLKQLEIHDVVHKRFWCATCGQRFFNSQCLQSHKVFRLFKIIKKSLFNKICPFQESHSVGYFCDYCPKNYKRKTRLVRHMLLRHVPQHPVDLPICRLCSQVFPTKELAELHSTTKHSHENVSNKPFVFSKRIEKVVLCEYCESAFHTVDQLNNHKRLAHTIDGLPQFECVHCEIKFDQYGKLKTHYNSHSHLKTTFTVPSWYCCEYCTKQFRSWRPCQVHRKNNHLSGVSVVECSDCGLGFHKIADFELHRKSVHSIGYKCPVCERSFSTSQSMNRHLTTVHIENRTPKQRKNVFKLVAEDGTISCLSCGHVAKSEQMLRIHVRQEHKEGMKVRFTCDLCQKVCKRKQALEEHMATVSNYF